MKKPLRLYRVAIVLASAVIGFAGAATVSPTADAALSGTNRGACTPATRDSFDHRLTFANGVATETVSLKKNSTACAQDVTLVTYFAPKPQFATPQYVFESKTATIDENTPTATLTANVPDCNTQIDGILGGQDAVINPLTDTSGLYGDKKLDSKNFGAQNCVQPAVQPVQNCDGSIDLQLSNNGYVTDKPSGYPVDFTITYGGKTETVSVASGKGATYPVPVGAGKVTVSADRLTPQDFTWTRPATCVPSVAAANDCKTVTVTVSNPEQNITVDAKVTYGTEAPKTVTVAAGKSEDVTFTAGEATSATVEFTNLGDVKPVTVAVVRGDCASPSPSASVTPGESSSASPSASASASASTSTGAGVPSSPAPSTSPVSSGGSLPVTGSAAGGIAGGAVLLLIIGGVLFFLARRRKVNFSA